jgi:hypothetical protein
MLMPSMLLARRSAVLLAGACAVLACGDMRSERTLPKVATPPVATKKGIPLAPTTPMRDECFGADSTETSAMKCAAGSVVRFVDTLQIRLAGAGVRKRIDRPQEDGNFRQYRYAGHIGGSSGGPGFHVLDARTHDRAWVELINELTGDSLVVVARPVISPDGARFLVSATGIVETCDVGMVLQIWRITDDAPVREFNVEPFNCGTNEGWGPSSVEWQSRDSISFLRNTVPRDSTRWRNLDWDTTRVTLVHRPEGWVMEPKP